MWKVFCYKIGFIRMNLIFPIIYIFWTYTIDWSISTHKCFFATKTLMRERIQFHEFHLLPPFFRWKFRCVLHNDFVSVGKNKHTILKRRLRWVQRYILYRILRWWGSGGGVGKSTTKNEPKGVLDSPKKEFVRTKSNFLQNSSKKYVLSTKNRKND